MMNAHSLYILVYRAALLTFVVAVLTG
jgi:hypothetical protein